MRGVHPKVWFYRYVRCGLRTLRGSLLPQQFKELYYVAKPRMTILEAKALYDFAKKNVGLGAIVEVGSALGGSACLLSQASKGANGEKTYCIDPWAESFWSETVADNWNTWRQSRYGTQSESLSSPYKNFLANVKKNGVSDLVEAIRGESQAVAKNWDNPIKLLFIDGSHEYKDVVVDIKSWEPHIVKNGVIAFHDYGAKSVGVTQAVNDLILPLKKFSKLKEVDSLVAFTKRMC